MNAPRIALIVAALVVATSFDLLAQQQEAPVAPGDRVRIAAPTVHSDGWLIGTVVEMAADTCVLAVQNQADTLVLPFASMRWLDVYRGRRSHWVAGTVVGALIGGAGGALVGYWTCVYELVETNCPATNVPVGILIGGTALGLVGAGIGHAIKADRWETVELDRLRVSMVPRRNGGLAMRVSLAF